MGKKRTKVAVLTIGLSYTLRGTALTVSENMYTKAVVVRRGLMLST